MTAAPAPAASAVSCYRGCLCRGCPLSPGWQLFRCRWQGHPRCWRRSHRQAALPPPAADQHRDREEAGSSAAKLPGSGWIMSGAATAGPGTLPAKAQRQERPASCAHRHDCGRPSQLSSSGPSGWPRTRRRQRCQPSVCCVCRQRRLRRGICRRTVQLRRSCSLPRLSQLAACRLCSCRCRCSAGEEAAKAGAVSAAAFRGCGRSRLSEMPAAPPTCFRTLFPTACFGCGWLPPPSPPPPPPSPCGLDCPAASASMLGAMSGRGAADSESTIRPRHTSRVDSAHSAHSASLTTPTCTDFRHGFGHRLSVSVMHSQG